MCLYNESSDFIQFKFFENYNNILNILFIKEENLNKNNNDINFRVIINFEIIIFLVKWSFKQILNFYNIKIMDILKRTKFTRKCNLI